MPAAQRKAVSINLIHEKRLKTVGVRVPETLKDTLYQRAASRRMNFSQHMIDLAVRDLRGQVKVRSTLSNAARELVRVAELAQAGIDSNEQKIWALQKVTDFQAAILA